MFYDWLRTSSGRVVGVRYDTLFWFEDDKKRIAARGGSRTVKQEVINLFYGNGTA